MRRNVSPFVLSIKAKASQIKMISILNQEQVLDQFIIKNKETELGLLEIDHQTKKIRNAFFIKFGLRTQRLIFSSYKYQSDQIQSVCELSNLIEQVVSNLNNGPLIRSLIAKQEFIFINHLKLKEHSLDSYDEELLENELRVDEIYVNGEKVSELKTLGKLHDLKPLQTGTGQRPSAPVPGTEPNLALAKATESQKEETIYGLKPNTIPKELESQFKAKYEEYRACADPSRKEWKLVESKEGLRLWQEHHPSYVIMLASIDIGHPLAQLAPLVADPQFRFKYDVLFKDFEILKVLTEQVAMIRAVIKGSFPVKDRDFVTCRVQGSPQPNVSAVDFSRSFISTLSRWVSSTPSLRERCEANWICRLLSWWRWTSTPLAILCTPNRIQRCSPSHSP